MVNYIENYLNEKNVAQDDLINNQNYGTIGNENYSWA
jgi:hypothetical protein